METTTLYSVCGHSLTAAFDTVSHDILISKIAGSFLPPAITRWLSCYLRGGQAATSFTGIKSSTRIVRTDVPQGSKLSPSLLISAPKSTVTLFTPDTQQFQTHPDITFEDTQLPLGVIMDPPFSFHKHCPYVTDMIDKINSMLNALVGSSWGQDKETLLLNYNALGKSIASYAAAVWSTNASDSCFKKIQTAHNTALRTTTGAHKMASIDHLYQEFLTLKGKDNTNMPPAQYLVNYLEEDHGCHGITTQEPKT